MTCKVDEVVQLVLLLVGFDCLLEEAAHQLVLVDTDSLFELFGHKDTGRIVVGIKMLGTLAFQFIIEHVRVLLVLSHKFPLQCRAVIITVRSYACLLLGVGIVAHLEGSSHVLGLQRTDDGHLAHERHALEGLSPLGQLGYLSLDFFRLVPLGGKDIGSKPLAFEHFLILHDFCLASLESLAVHKHGIRCCTFRITLDYLQVGLCLKVYGTRQDKHQRQTNVCYFSHNLTSLSHISLQSVYCLAKFVLELGRQLLAAFQHGLTSIYNLCLPF